MYNKEELILQDFDRRLFPPPPNDDFFGLYQEVTTEEPFASLYQEYEQPLARIFAYLHQNLNALLEHLNKQLDKGSSYYHAGSSRELISIIDTVNELKSELETVGKEIILTTEYSETCAKCKTFLVDSGGSTIPDDMKKVKIIKYDPIFELAETKIILPHVKTIHKLSLVGEGSFAIVQKYKDEAYDRTFAVKRVKKSSGERDIIRFNKEYEILKRLSFPYILEVYSYDTSNNSYIMEYCDYTLDKYIAINNQTLSFDKRRKLALQFLYGINYIHQKDLLHRDISFGNALIKCYDYGAVIVKLSDFGLAKEKDSDFTKTDTTLKGTIRDPYLEKLSEYSLSNEIYAIGHILQYIFTGKKRLTDEKNAITDIVKRCTNGSLMERYEHVSDIIKDLESVQ